MSDKRNQQQVMNQMLDLIKSLEEPEDGFYEVTHQDLCKTENRDDQFIYVFERLRFLMASISMGAARTEVYGPERLP